MHSDFIASEADSDKLHAMRIAGKRLRYTMEIFAPLYGGDLEPFILAMKEIQDTLGEFHDADVWISWLPKFVDKEKARIEDYFGNTGPLERLMPGIHHLMAYNEQIRSDTYQSFLMTWQTLADDNAWQILCELLTPPPLPLEGELEDVDILNATDELPDWIEEGDDDDDEDTEEIVNFTELSREMFAVEEAEETPESAQEKPLSAEETDEDNFIDLTDTFPTEE